MVLNIKHPAIHYNKHSLTFSVELSDLSNADVNRACREGSPIYVFNPTTNRQIKMIQFTVDTDGSGEDIYGFWYKGVNPKTTVEFEFLFIND
jgi:hypothetical protein